MFDNAPFVRPIPGLPLLTAAPLKNSDTFRELTWRASLDRHITDELMGYVSVSRGFQSGGWNLQTPRIPRSSRNGSTTSRRGLKFADRTHRFRADANIFYYDYSDLQVSALTPIGQATTNAIAEIYGLELQLDARLGRRTDVSFGAQLLQARYKDFPTRPAPISARPSAFLTCRSRATSPATAAIRAKAKVQLRCQPMNSGLGCTLLLSGNFAYNSGYVAEPDNVVRQTLATVDLSAEWQPARGGRRSGCGRST